MTTASLWSMSTAFPSRYDITLGLYKGLFTITSPSRFLDSSLLTRLLNLSWYASQTFESELVISYKHPVSHKSKYSRSGESSDTKVHMWISGLG